MHIFLEEETTDQRGYRDAHNPLDRAGRGGPVLRSQGPAVSLRISELPLDGTALPSS